MALVFLSTALACAILGAAFDVASHKIPNRLTYPCMFLGLALRTSLLSWRGLGSAVAGGLLGGGIFLLLYLVRGMGAGDVKLITAIGCITGPQEIAKIMIACGLAGGIMAIAVMVARGRIGNTLRNVFELLRFLVTHGPRTHPSLNIDNPRSIRLPYGVAIAAGTMYAFFTVAVSG